MLFSSKITFIFSFSLFFIKCHVLIVNLWLLDTIAICTVIIYIFYTQWTNLKVFNWKQFGNNKPYFVMIVVPRYWKYMRRIFRNCTVDECINAGSLQSRWLFWLCFRKFSRCAPSLHLSSKWLWAEHYMGTISQPF